jgi:hypothetical protein
MTLRRTIIQSNFDSVLDPAAGATAAKLTISLKVSLVPLDPSAGGTSPVRMHPGPAHLAPNASAIRKGNVVDANYRPVQCRSWMVPEWNAFSIRFKQIVEMSWNNQIILLPWDDGDPRDVLGDDDYRQFIANPRIQAHAECALRINLMPRPGPFDHAVIEVVHVDNPAAHFRNRMLRISDQSILFKKHFDARWPNAFFGQASAAHEIGHWLHDLTQTVFAHEDATYTHGLHRQPGETSAQFRKRRDHEQYGHVLGRREAMMGAGNLVTEQDAAAWLARIRRHTGKLGWAFVHRVNFGHMLSELPPRQQQIMAAMHR